MSKLNISNLVKRFGKGSRQIAAIDGVSFEVASGNFVIMLGPSGCGKTTMLRCIAGLEDPDEGDIFIDDTRVNDLSPKDRDIAMVFQNYALYPHKSVYSNLAFPLESRKVPKVEVTARVKEVSQLLNIEHLLSRRPRELSGGEQQRVALGRAIVRTPKVFLMDEPLSNLDAKLRIFVRAELKRLQKDLGTTTVYVTHDQAEAMAMADKVVVMNKGKVQQYDTPSSIYSKPSNAFVAGFVGNPPMNLINARIIERDGALAIQSNVFTYLLPTELSDAIRKSASDTEVLLGIRPEDLQISVEKGSNGVFQGEVYVYEHMGPNMVIDVKVESSLLKAISPPISLDLGSKIWLSFSAEKIHLFDRRTENAII